MSSMKKMNLVSRIIIGIASLALIATFFLPVWFIFLIAPQYPEGLTMNIWLNRITGQVDIINGLNHYIGMKHIKAEMFPEFQYMSYIVAFFVLLGLVVAISGNRKILISYLILTVIGGAAAMYDFYKWGYDYGHNLDPKAAIQIPGLSYQPPLFGHKTLLNFDAYSYPDVGGWVIIGVSILFFLVWMYEWRINRKQKPDVKSISKKTIPVVVTIFILFLSSCSAKPEPFNYGKDICADCSMTIMDPKFGAQIITDKGKICFLRLNIFYLADLFNGFMLIDITTKPIDSIGWINNNSPIFEAIHHLANQSLLGVIRVNVYEHGLKSNMRKQM